MRQLIPPRRRLIQAGGVFILLAGLGIACFCRSYPGISRGMLSHARYSSIKESRNLHECISYWLEFMERLSFNENEQKYDFNNAIATVNKDDCFALGLIEYHRGNFTTAVEHISRSVDVDGENEEKLFWLGFSHLRIAESCNCLHALVKSDPTQCDGMQVCSLPILCGHSRPASADTAAHYFRRILDEYDADNRLYQWLLCFCNMTTGKYPEQVPEKYRAGNHFTDTFYGAHAEDAKATYENLVFRDEAKRLGVDTMDTGRGVAVEDFDRDGFLDIVTGGSFHDVKYYRNRGGIDFEDTTEAVGLKSVMQPFCISAADYDNDGWIDLFVARPFDRYQLFRNSQGTFEDVTEETGLLQPLQGKGAATWISAWSDIDNDGDLDLFLAQWGMRLPGTKGLMGRPRADSILFTNTTDARGRRTFVDSTASFGLGPTVRDNYFIGATFGDYDDDGFPDLFLSSPLRKTSVLCRNLAGKKFARTSLISRPEGGFTASFVDVDHDGRLDLFQAGFGDARSCIEQSVFGDGLGNYLSGNSAVYRQNGDGSFSICEGFFDSRMPMSTMGANFGDLNNDGAIDFYLGTGTPEGWFVLPNLMYVGQLDGAAPTLRTQNISMLNGFGTIQKGHGIVFFDFDNDGDQDIYSSLGGMWPGDAWPNQMLVNHSKLKNNWVKIRLHGTTSNYYGVGATIRIIGQSRSGDEIIRYHHMNGKTGFGSAPFLAHVGLHTATSISRVEVTWPTSGQVRSYRVGINTSVSLREDEGTCIRENDRISTQ